MMPRILLAEDNELNRDMLLRRLARRGYDVVVAVNGQQAVDMAASTAPDVVLMDLDLPVLTGIEATQAIRGRAATHDVPIIALTAHATVSDRDLALEAGCNDYETKPIDLPKLLEKIEALLARVPADPRTLNRETP